jgi:hypothetical protein
MLISQTSMEPISNIIHQKSQALSKITQSVLNRKLEGKLSKTNGRKRRISPEQG